MMVALGGYTRLTNSGLSMTDWKPISGVIPPITSEQWQAEFNNYKLSPEYIHINKGFSLSDFKQIFIVEYLHRVLGRFIGICFFIPFICFALAKKLTRNFSLKLLGIFALGGLQGLMGWYMVKSGLSDDPHVSQYRLSAHLLLAMLIYMLLVLCSFRTKDVSLHNERNTNKNLYKLCWLFVGLIFFQSMLGGFVAGLKAGFVYNSFPLMDGQIIPNGAWDLQPWYKNLTDNTATIQLIHRFNAFILLFVGIVIWLKGITEISDNKCKIYLHIFMAAILIQISLGILTLIHAVPVTLGVIHQVAAFILLTCTLILCNRIKFNSHSAQGI